MSRGARGKYNKEMVGKICQLIEEGDNYNLVCKKVGIHQCTFYDWLNNRPEFSQKVKEAGDAFRAAITAKLEESLWRRATGYEFTETEVEKVRSKSGEMVVKSRREKKKQLPPDVAALIFALTNVAPEKWVNRVRAENTLEVGQKEAAKFDNLPDDVLFELADKLQAALLASGGDSPTQETRE